MEKNLAKDSVVQLPLRSREFINEFQIGCICIIAFTLIAGFLMVFLFICKLFSSAFGLRDNLIIFTSGFAAFFSFLSSSFITSLSCIIKAVIDRNLAYLNIKYLLGKYALTYTWVSTFVTTIAYICILTTSWRYRRRGKAWRLY